MIVDKGQNIVKNVTLKNLTKEIEQGSGSLERGISLTFVLFKDGDDFNSFSGKGIVSKFEGRI